MKNLEIILNLQSTNSRNDKEQILLEAWNSGNREFFKALRLCLDSLIRFGVKQIPEKTENSGSEWLTFDNFYNLAIDLKERNFTGHAARDTILSNMEACDKDEWNLFYRPILLKDLRSGLNEATFNKVLKKVGPSAQEYLIPEYPYQRCSTSKDVDLNECPWEDGMLSQIKSDGMFANVNLMEDKTIEILSRNGKTLPLEEINYLTTDILNTFLSETQTHGELLIVRNNTVLPREIGNGILNSLFQKGTIDREDKVMFVAWDQIPLSSAKPKGTYSVPYSQRFKDLCEQIKSSNAQYIKQADHRVVFSVEEAYKHYIEMLNLGLEGTILKYPCAEWKDGTSKKQIKLKVEVVVELRIKGFNPGKGKNAHLFGSIIAESEDQLLEVSVSGLKDDFRKMMHENREELVGSIISVKANSIMKPTSSNEKYSLFLPRFVEIRYDKSTADDLNKIVDQFDSVLKNI